MDIQGFKSVNYNFIIKKLAGTRSHNPCDKFYLCFTTPFPWLHLLVNYRKMNLWCIRNHCGMKCKGGGIPDSELTEQLNSGWKNTSQIYVKRYGKEIRILEMTSIIVTSYWTTWEIHHYSNCNPSSDELDVFKCQSNDKAIKSSYYSNSYAKYGLNRFSIPGTRSNAPLVLFLFSNCFISIFVDSEPQFA